MGRLIDIDKVEFIKVDGNEEFNHGVDCCIRRLLKEPIVEAILKADIQKSLKEGSKDISENVLAIVREEYISKADYENRLKADMVAMLTEIQLEILELKSYESADGQDLVMLADIGILFQQKINTLKAESEEV